MPTLARQAREEFRDDPSWPRLRRVRPWLEESDITPLTQREWAVLSLWLRRIPSRRDRLRWRNMLYLHFPCGMMPACAVSDRKYRNGERVCCEVVRAYAHARSPEIKTKRRAS